MVDKLQLKQKLVWPLDGKEMLLVPAGKFIMGDDQAHWDDQKPAHVVFVDSFFIDRYPVTNVEYRRFVEATGHRAPQGLWSASAEHPVRDVSWDDAWAFARWAGKRLPSEAEWEKAASWDPARQVKSRYPWGDEWRAMCCNIIGAGGPGDTTPVGAYSPQGDSPYGAADMIGNVWEWCSSAMTPYPYRPANGCEDLTAPTWRVLRGAAWDTVLERDARCTFRYVFPSDFFLPSFGCRCAISLDDVPGDIIGGEQ